MSPFGWMRSVWLRRDLALQMAVRDLSARFKGSALGWLWMLATPLLMLAVYTFVFSAVFNLRWAERSGAEAGEGGKLDFALRLFAGLMVFNLFSEVLARAPGLIMQHQSFVKRVVFPLDILSVMTALTASVTLCASLGVFAVLYVIAEGLPPVTALWLPLAFVPVLLTALGLSWALSAAGVFFRDVQQAVAVVLSALVFVSPIFYPVSLVPEPWRVIVLTNPLTSVIGVVRGMLFDGEVLWVALGLSWAVGLVVAWLGHSIFTRARGAFADVI